MATLPSQLDSKAELLSWQTVPTPRYTSPAAQTAAGSYLASIGWKYQQPTGSSTIAMSLTPWHECRRMLRHYNTAIQNSPKQSMK